MSKRTMHVQWLAPDGRQYRYRVDDRDGPDEWRNADGTRWVGDDPEVVDRWSARFDDEEYWVRPPLAEEERG